MNDTSCKAVRLVFMPRPNEFRLGISDRDLLCRGLSWQGGWNREKRHRRRDPNPSEKRPKCFFIIDIAKRKVVNSSRAPGKTKLLARTSVKSEFSLILYGTVRDAKKSQARKLAHCIGRREMVKIYLVSVCNLTHKEMTCQKQHVCFRAVPTKAIVCKKKWSPCFWLAASIASFARNCRGTWMG